MLTWFCSQCFQDVEGSVWDGLDKESGKVLCEKCRVLKPENLTGEVSA